MIKQTIFIFKENKIIIENLRELGYAIIDKRYDFVYVTKELPFTETLVNSLSKLATSNNDYFTIMATQKEAKIKELRQIKELFLQKDYFKIKKDFLKKLTKINTKITKLTDKAVLLEKKELKKSLKNSNQSASIIEDQILKSNSLIDTIYKSAAYQALAKELTELNNANYLLSRSIDLINAYQKNYRLISKQADLLILIDEIIAEYELAAIKVAPEALELKDVFFTILQETEHFIVVFSDNKAATYELILKIPMNDLAIENLAFLGLNQALEITR